MSKVLILLTSTVDHLREAIDDTVRSLPDASITVCAQEDIARGIEGFAGVANLVTARRVGSVSFALSSSFLRKLREDRYSLSVVLQEHKAARIGVRAIALALLVRCSRRRVHVSGVGFAPLSRVLLASLSPWYLARRPVILLDKLLGVLIRKTADLAVWFMLLNDRRRRRREK